MGYSRGDRILNGMWSKSSKQFADRFEARLIKIGLGLVASIFCGRNSKSLSRSKAVVNLYTYTASVDNTIAEPSELTAKSAKVLCAILLFLSILFQLMGFVSYRSWSFFVFFSLLVFSSLALICIGFSFMIAEECKELGENRRKSLSYITLAVTFVVLALSLWPLFVKDYELTYLSAGLLILEDVLLIGVTINSFYESSLNFKIQKYMFPLIIRSIFERF